MSTTPNAIDAQEENCNDSGNSLNANALEQHWTLSDLLTKEEGFDTIEVKEHGISNSVILDIETPQGETDALGLEENSSNKPKTLDCTITSHQQICTGQLIATDDNSSISITIDDEKDFEDLKDDICENNDP